MEDGRSGYIARHGMSLRGARSATKQSLLGRGTPARNVTPTDTNH
jgi:hypothetical protein